MMNEDYIIRASAADHQLRVFAVTSRNLVEEARKIHNTSPVATAAAGRLLTAGSMMGSMMKGDKDILTLQIQCGGPIGGLTVTADSKANVKCYVKQPGVLLPPNSKGKLDVAGALGPGFLNVIRDIGMKEPYNGQTHLVSGEIAEDLTYYFTTSEQTPSSVALGVLMNRENTVRQAGGFILQMMPGATEEVIAGLEKKLAQLTSVTALLDEGKTPEEILEYILGDYGLDILERTPVRFHCNCSRERIDKALISVGKQELQRMVEEGETIEVNCHFCNRHYPVTVEELQHLLEQAR